MKVPISQIRPNAFQVRQHVDRERIQALADEIKALGFWGSLRARKQGNHYELCFGHRRLEALKLLKVKEIDLEIVNLSDEDMMTHALVENLQREGLTDIDKANGIVQLMNRFEQLGQSNPKPTVAKFLGISEGRLSQLISLTNLSKQSQRLIASRQIAGATAVRAKQIGGEDMIATAVKHALPQITLQQIQQELVAIPEKTTREKVTRAVVSGRLRDPESVRTHARQLRAKQTGPVPSDLRLLVRKWTKAMRDWMEVLDAASEYRDYIEGDPTGSAQFKAAARELIDKLKRFL